MRNSNHFEVLGIPRGADDLQVKEAYFRLARRFHPDLQRDPALADLKKECEALFMRIGDAYEVLRNPKSRARYEAELLSRESRPPSDLGGAAVGESPEALDTVQNALLADDAIRRAGELVVESQYWDAIQLLETTLPRIQSKRLQHEAQVLLARAYMRNPKWLRRGEELLQSVVREDPSWADAYFVLGTIYRSKGLKTRAVTMFRKVLELKPNHKPAAAEIRALGEAPPPAKQERRV
jgi:tetratricopeptide (TPR) repeat protein